MKSQQDKFESNFDIDNTGSKTPEEIENDIMRTRARMSDTLDEIERRISPGQIMDEVLGYFKTGSSEFGANLAGSVKQNPMPTMLVAVGLGWLMMSGKSQNNDSISYSMDGRSSKTGALSNKVREVSSTVTSAAHHSVDSLKHGAASVRDQASELVHTASDATQRLSATLRDKSNRLSYVAKDQAMKATESYKSLIQEQPLVIGALGIALGALIGAALPRTRPEDQLLGETSDRIVGKLKEAGQEHMEKAQEVAKRVAETAQTEIKQQLQSDENSNQILNTPTH